MIESVTYAAASELTHNGANSKKNIESLFGKVAVDRFGYTRLEADPKHPLYA